MNLTDSPLLLEVSFACPLCSQILSVDEIDSHALQHAIESENLDQNTIADDIYYEKLRASYSLAIRGGGTGTCYICGEAGHWVRDCPKNHDYIVAQARVLPQPTAAAVAAVQLPDPQFQRPPFDPEAMLRLLGECTTKQYLSKEYTTCTTLLCGTVVHFGGQRIDSGWGCGYRNIQMMAAYLLATDELSAKALFSGSHYVPDIPSLQAWIEVAWRAGFDSVGAQQLGRQLQGGKKWIGTTEAAALFRYFGIPAIIVDFGNSDRNDPVSSENDNILKQQPPQRHQTKVPATASTSSRGGGGGSTTAEEGPSDPRKNSEARELHEGIQCDVCGSFPIYGERFTSRVLPNYDVCSHCLENTPEIKAAAGPFSRVSVGGMAGPWSTFSDNNNRRKTECSPAGKSLCHWVWEYFSQVDSGSSEDIITKPSALPFPSASPNLHLSRSGPGWMVETRYTCLCPLYLQHEGHSRTIIGAEKKERHDGTYEITLLMLDPGVPPPALQDALEAGIKWQRLIKRSEATLNKLQYQILYCPNGAIPTMPGSTYYEALKILAAQKKL